MSQRWHCMSWHIFQEGRFTDMPESNVVVTSDPSSNWHGTAKLRLDAKELRVLAGKLQGNTAIEYTINMFVGMVRWYYIQRTRQFTSSHRRFSIHVLIIFSKNLTCEIWMVPVLYLRATKPVGTQHSCNRTIHRYQSRSWRKTPFSTFSTAGTWPDGKHVFAFMLFLYQKFQLHFWVLMIYFVTGFRSRSSTSWAPSWTQLRLQREEMRSSSKFPSQCLLATSQAAPTANWSPFHLCASAKVCVRVTLNVGLTRHVCDVCRSPPFTFTSHGEQDTGKIDWRNNPIHLQVSFVWVKRTLIVLQNVF